MPEGNGGPLQRMGSSLVGARSTRDSGALKKKNLLTAGRPGRIGKTPHLFAFEVLVEEINGPIGNRTVVVTAERKKVVLATTAKRAGKDNTKMDEVLSRNVTLFGDANGENFLEKKFTIAVRDNNEAGKVLGKTALDFSKYAVTPFGVKRLSCTLTNGLAVVLKISSTFLESNGSNYEPSEAGSQSVAEMEDRANDEAFLDENIDKDPNLYKPTPEDAEPKELKKELAKLEQKKRELERENADLKKQATMEQGRGRDSVRNRRTQVNKKGSMTTAGQERMKQLENEHEELTTTLSELQEILNREPQHADMMAELQKAKKKLAELSVAKEQAETELRALQAERARRRKKIFK